MGFTCRECSPAYLKGENDHEQETRKAGPDRDTRLLDLLAGRSDVVMVMTDYGDGIKVINGVRRGEDFRPLIIRPTGEYPDKLAGFGLVPPDEFDLTISLPTVMLAHWKRLPQSFTWNEALAIVPKSTLARLIRRATAIGALKRDPLSPRRYVKAGAACQSRD